MINSLLILFGLIFAAPTALAGASSGLLVKKPNQIALTSDEQWQLALALFAKDQYQQALQHVKSALGGLNFRDRPHALFLMGECQYQLGEWDVSAAQFSKLVELEKSGEYFESSLHYLWKIAENYRTKRCHHLLGYESLPRWSADQSPCLALYNQITEALPYGDLACQALLAKGKYLRAIGNFGHSNEALYALLYSFPTHLKTEESYRLIGLNLLDIMQLSPGDEELLASAVNNLNRFKLALPLSQEVLKTERDVAKMGSLFAEDLIKTGKYYERRKLPRAAVIYYQSALNRFPQTRAGLEAKGRLPSIESSKS